MGGNLQSPLSLTLGYDSDHVLEDIMVAVLKVH